MHTTKSNGDVDSIRQGARLSVLMTALFYGLLGILGVGWMLVAQLESFGLLFEIRSLPLHGTMGFGLGVLVVLFSRFSVHRFDWARGMEEEFRVLLRDQPFWTVPLLALFSAVGEEIFFRGALQELIGIWLQAAIFGVIHFPFSRKMWAWPVFAFLMGVLFGGSTIWTGTIWMAVVAHGTINGFNMWMILRKSEGE